jgi:hypothetical protein
MREVAPHLNISEHEAFLFDAEEAQDLEGVLPIPGQTDVLLPLFRERWAVVTSSHTGTCGNQAQFCRPADTFGSNFGRGRATRQAKPRLLRN